MNKDAQPHNLVINGGAAHAMAYIGVLSRIPADWLGGVGRIAGISSGSLMATMLAVGYTIYEICDNIWNTDTPSMFDKGLTFGIYNLFSGYGVCGGKILYRRISEIIRYKTGNEKMTFLELYMYARIELTIFLTNANTCESEDFNMYTHPNCQIRDAIRASMSMPYIFVVKPINGVPYIDGNLSISCPVEYYDSAKYYDGRGQNPNTLGMRLQWNGNITVGNVLDLTRVILYKLVRDVADKNLCENGLRIINIPLGSVRDVRQFDCKNEYNTLVVRGYTAADDYYNHVDLSGSLNQASSMC